MRKEYFLMVRVKYETYQKYLFYKSKVKIFKYLNNNLKRKLDNLNKKFFYLLFVKFLKEHIKKILFFFK